MASASGAASNRNSGIGSGASQARTSSSRCSGSVNWAKVVSQVTATLAGYCISRGSCQPKHLGALRLPALEVLGEREPQLVDVGPGLLQRQGQPVQLAGDRGGPGRVVGRLAAVRRALQQEGRGVGRGQHVQLQRLDPGTPVADPRGDQHVAGPEPRQQPLDLAGRLVGIDVVDDQQPAGMGVEPAEHLGQLLVDRGPLGGHPQHADQVGQVGAELGERWGRDEQQGGVVVGMPPGILERGPGLAHASQPVHGRRFTMAVPASVASRLRRSSRNASRPLKSVPIETNGRLQGLCGTSPAAGNCPCGGATPGGVYQALLDQPQHSLVEQVAPRGGLAYR